jgi:hypothetical protein
LQRAAHDDGVERNMARLAGGRQREDADGDLVQSAPQASCAILIYGPRCSWYGQL